MKTVGVDLGTSHVVAATANGDRVRLVPNRQGGFGFSSFATISSSGEATFRPRRSSQLYSGTGIRKTLRRLEQSRSEHGQKHSPIGLLTALLRTLRESCDDHLGAGPISACISVPPMLNGRARMGVMKAAHGAGFEVLQLIGSTTAAARAWGFRSHFNGDVIVVDMGAGTLDAAKLSLSRSAVTSETVGGSTRLGGFEFDRRIAQAAAESFRARFGRAPSMDTDEAVKAIEGIKDGVGKRDTIPITLAAPGERGRIVSLSKDDLELALRPLVEEFDRLVAPILFRTFVEPIVLHGRQIGYPAFARIFSRQLFPRSGLAWFQQGELVAEGAALEARLLGKGLEPSRERAGLALGLRIGDVEYPRIVKPDDELPVASRVRFVSPDGRRVRWVMELRQGNHPSLTIRS